MDLLLYNDSEENLESCACVVKLGHGKKERKKEKKAKRRLENRKFSPGPGSGSVITDGWDEDAADDYTGPKAATRAGAGADQSAAPRPEARRLRTAAYVAATAPHRTSPHRTAPHLTSPHLTSPHIGRPAPLCLSPAEKAKATHNETTTWRSPFSSAAAVR